MKVIYVGLPTESFPTKRGKGRLWTRVSFSGCASNSQDLPKASPRAIFKWKSLIEPLKILSQWMRWGENCMPTWANMCHYAPTWANIAVCQLCTEMQPVRNGWPGSMPWRSFPWVYNGLHQDVYITMVIYAGLPVDISVSLWLRKQRPRFAQGQPKGYFQMKELDRTTEDIVPMNEMWRKLHANMSQHVSLRANMGQHCSLSAVHRNAACEERMAWINAMAFVPMSLQ